MVKFEPVYILDSSFFLSGIAPPDGELLTIPEVAEEVRLERKELLFAIAKGLRVVSPSQEALKKVREAAAKTGDDARMSETDISLIALALEIGGTLLTDDYSIQNTAEIMGIPYLPVAQRGIKRVEKWYYRCAYCGRYFSEPMKECPVCGGPVRRTRRPPKGMKGNRMKGVGVKESGMKENGVKGKGMKGKNSEGGKR